MRSPPPVVVDCDGSAAWRGVQSALHGLAGAAVAAWLGAAAEWSAASSAALALLAAGASGAVSWRVLHARPVRLGWDGQAWSLSGEPTSSAAHAWPEVMIDLGDWLLLRLRAEAPSRKARWLAVSARPAGGGLHALRAALYCPPSQPHHRVRSPERQPD